MRILFTLIPGTGTLHPLLPVADALQDRGHEVAFCSAPRLAPDVEQRGLAFFPAGIDWHTSDPDYIGTLCAAAGGLDFPPLVGMERLAWVVDHLFIGGAATNMLPDVVSIARQWQADLVVRQSLEFSGCAAAEHLGLPHASVADAANSALDLRQTLAEPLSRLRDRLGLPPDPAGDMAYRHLHLCFTPPRFDGPEAVFPATARFFRHTNPRSPVPEVAAWPQLPEGRPTVLVSMGTVFHRTPGIYEAVIDALRDEPLNVVVALGFDQDPGRLGPLPERIVVEPYLPLHEVLADCDVFVTHGGFNSVKESLSAGVPMVVIPISADQPYSAQRCGDLGVATTIGPEERTPSRIRGAVHTVLNDPSFTSRAHQMQKEMAALPDLGRAVDLLEALTTPAVCPAVR